MMNRCGAYQQKVMGLSGCGFRLGAAAAVAEARRPESICAFDGVVCPKPRRIGLFNPSSIHDDDVPIRPPRCPSSRQMEAYDSKAGTELLDIILTKGSCGADKLSAQAASSPPYFCGSPPSRASNPLIQDAQFCNGQLIGFSPAPEASPRKSGGGGCVPVKYGQKPAAVRIEGFNCRGISAVA